MLATSLIIVIELRFGFIFKQIYLPLIIATAAVSTYALFSHFFVMRNVYSLSTQYFIILTKSL